MTLQAIFPVEETDITEIWDRVEHKENATLGGNSRGYSLIYEGDTQSSLEILETILEYKCQVLLET